MECKRDSFNGAFRGARKTRLRSQCVSLAPPGAPLKLSLFHSIVERRCDTGSTHNKIRWVQPRQRRRAYESARDRIFWVTRATRSLFSQGFKKLARVCARNRFIETTTTTTTMTTKCDTDVDSLANLVHSCFSFLFYLSRFSENWLI